MLGPLINSVPLLPKDESEVCVQDVQATSQYVLHVGELTKGQVKVGDKVSLGIDKVSTLVACPLF